MPDDAWIYALIPLAAVALLGGLAFFIGYRGVRQRRIAEVSPRSLEWNGQALPTSDAGQAMRSNARVFSQAPDETAVLVYYLDFVSADCRKVQRFIDELRQEFGHNVTFTARYFPQPGNPQSEAAAIAVEAAAQQDRFNEMLAMMYETQPQWAGASWFRADHFRRFAKDLQLDMVKFDHAVADSRTQERIATDMAHGTALGVSGTPTFFLLDGEKVEAASLDQFYRIVSNAAAGRK